MTRPTRLFMLMVCAGAARALAAEPSELSAPVVSEATLNAPIEAVWKAYTDRETIESWMVATSSEVDLSIGGKWRTSYDANSKLDDDTVIENEVLAFDPGRMLAVRTIRPPADFPFPNAILDTWTVLYLEPVGDNQTKATVKMFGFTADDESQKMRAFFEWGNAYELEKLATHLEVAY